MWEKFKSLPTIWKVVVIAVILALALFIFDLFTGSVRDVKNWMFDRNQAKIEEQNAELLKENEEFRKKIETYLVEIEKLKVKEILLDAQIEKVGGQLEKNKETTEQALAEVEKEMAETAQPTDFKTRCERTKAKMVAMGIKTAKDIECNER